MITKSANRNTILTKITVPLMRGKKKINLIQVNYYKINSYILETTYRKSSARRIERTHPPTHSIPLKKVTWME